MARIDNEQIVRDPIQVNPDQSLVCVGEVPEGSLVYILNGNNDSLIQAANKAVQLCVDSFPPLETMGTLFMIDCISRVLFLEDQFDLELEAAHHQDLLLMGACTLGEMAMAVGTSLDLNKMLKSSLTIYLKKLSCSSGVIYQTFRHSDNQWRFLTRCAIPRNAGKKLLTQNSMPIIPEQFDGNDLKQYFSNLPMAGKTDTRRTFHVMELPEFGILVLVKSGDQIDPNTVQSLTHINTKLAGSAISCLQNEKIEQINQQLSQEIVVRKQAEKTKNQFLANMSHELLTPMNGIIGLNKLLLNSGLTESQFELANDLSSSAESLLNILKNLFEFSLINAEKQVLEAVNFDLHRLVSDLINAFSDKAVEKNLELHSTIDPNIPQLLISDVKNFILKTSC